ncbi:conserved hypothetical protein [Ricinus communis]|uniref:Uncharacterized protein n=1 Tax=Ricinus communis TaxID=3988 RepID=B9SND7_RICCO|nr:conserved hypothetical protein [Ricinus communis]
MKNHLIPLIKTLTRSFKSEEKRQHIINASFLDYYTCAAESCEAFRTLSSGNLSHYHISRLTSALVQKQQCISTSNAGFTPRPMRKGTVASADKWQRENCEIGYNSRSQIPRLDSPTRQATAKH